ncbi:MAG: hypothetical protein HYT49_02855 [Candidatus Wildermuthbacteria bacterium]|nr:hypothetical protein [Candidatus Wildermuthbacteria bacterium]
MKKVQSENGFTILEIIAATFVVVLVVGGVYSLVVFNLRVSGDVARNLEAAYLAQEGIEVVRNLRDTNFLAIRYALCDPFQNPNAWKGVIDDPGSCSGPPLPVVDLTNCSAGCEAQYDSVDLEPYADAFLLRDSNGIYNYTTGSATPFKRKITIDDTTRDSLKVDVEVSWHSQRVVASTELYNWLILPQPRRSNGSPSGILPAGTISATIELTTNQNATCRYSTTAGVRYTAMSDIFFTTGGTAHSQNVSGLANGESYTYYVRCTGHYSDPLTDPFYNANVTDFIISFDIANP